MSGIYFWLFASLGIAGAAIMWRNKRRFDRTNEHGVQQFSRYSEKVRAETFDKLLLVVGYIGLLTSVGLLLALDPTILTLGLIALGFVYLVRRGQR